MGSLREIAWDGRGRWCGDGPAPSMPRPATQVPHQCGNRRRPHRQPDCGVFTCGCCKRVVPWCFGVAGETRVDDQLCDDCGCKYDRVKEARRAI